MSQLKLNNVCYHAEQILASLLELRSKDACCSLGISMKRQSATLRVEVRLTETATVVFFN